MAVIDIGTNSIKLLVAEKQRDGFEILEDISKVVRLGDGLAQTGEISTVASARTIEALASFVQKAKALGAREVLAIATETLRVAKNAQAFIAEAARITGVRIRVIDGAEEARLSFAAVDATACGEPVLMFDSGGGSTEFVFGKEGRPLCRISAPIGALTLFDRFFKQEEKISDAALAQARAFTRAVIIDAGFSEIKKYSSDSDHKLVGVGGTVTVLGSVSLSLARYDRNLIEGISLGRPEIRRQIELDRNSSFEMRKHIPGMPADRAEIAPAGAILAEEILFLTGKEDFFVSTRGLRHGAMARLFQNCA